MHIVQMKRNPTGAPLRQPPTSRESDSILAEVEAIVKANGGSRIVGESEEELQVKQSCFKGRPSVVSGLVKPWFKDSLLRFVQGAA